MLKYMKNSYSKIVTGNLNTIEYDPDLCGKQLKSMLTTMLLYIYIDISDIQDLI